MNTLPIELENRIWNDYWQMYFTDNILNDITYPYELSNEINTFVFRYCFRCRFFDNVYHHYLVILNEKIKDFVLNYTLLFNNNTATLCGEKSNMLKYCFSIKPYIIKYIHHSLWYISTYCISISNGQRYKVYKRFRELSLLH